MSSNSTESIPELIAQKPTRRRPPVDEKGDVIRTDNPAVEVIPVIGKRNINPYQIIIGILLLLLLLSTYSLYNNITKLNETERVLTSMFTTDVITHLHARMR
jgi:hypothetical protein